MLWFDVKKPRRKDRKIINVLIAFHLLVEVLIQEIDLRSNFSYPIHSYVRYVPKPHTMNR